MTEEEKREQLRQLAGKVSACHLCKTIYSSPGYRKGDHLSSRTFRYGYLVTT